MLPQQLVRLETRRAKGIHLDVLLVDPLAGHELALELENLHRVLAGPCSTGSLRLERWPQFVQIQVRYRAGFAYVDGVLADGDQLRLCQLPLRRLRQPVGFTIYRASHNDYEDSYLPPGSMGGTAEDALDTACGLYLGDPAAWT